MLTVKGKLSIAKEINGDRVRVILEDDAAGCRAAVAELRFDDFARALFGQAFIDCTLQINDSGLVGKVREHRVVDVLVPRDLAYRGNMDDEGRLRALRRLADDCPEAPAFECWQARMDDFDNMHNRGTARPDGLVPIRVLFERWVDPPAEPEPQLYRCAAASCPGLPYRASDTPHPCRDGKPAGGSTSPSVRVRPRGLTDDLARNVLARLEAFERLERKNTDEAGWIMLALGVTRLRAEKLIIESRRMRERGAI